MKKLFLLLAAFTFVGVASAQEKPVKEAELTEKTHQSKNNLDEWSKELNLTDAQKVEVQKINESYKTKKQAIRSTGTAADFKKLNDAKKEEIDAVLTSEQREKQVKLHEQKTLDKQKKAEMRASKK